MAFLALRPLCIVAGGTAVGYALVGRAADARPQRLDQPPGFWTWLGDVVNPDSSATAAIGNTMVLAAAGVLLGVVLGAAIGAVARAGRPGRLLARLVLVAVAIAVPGFLLHPLTDAAARQGLVPAEAVSLQDSAEDGTRFLLLWGTVVALAVIPAVVSLIADGAGRRSVGDLVVPAPIRAWSASRPEATPRWRFGFPTTVFLATLAVTELLSGHPGIFPRFFGALRAGDSGPVLDVLFWALIGGAALAIAVDLAGSLTRDLATENRSGPTRSAGSRSAGPALAIALAVGGVLVVVAGLGSVFGDPSATTGGALEPPTIGGPWLGTDALGRDTLATVTAALWPVMLTGVAAAMLATALGAMAAWLRLALPTTAGRLFDVAVDGLWWPVPMMVPLGVLAMGDLDRARFDPILVLMLGLSLVPLAARLLARSVPVGARPAWPAEGLAAVAAAIAAMSSALFVVIDFAGDRATNLNPGLGSLLAQAVADYRSAPWPFLAPAIALGALVAVLSWLSASFGARTTSVGHRPAIVAGGSEPDSDRTGVMPVAMAEEPPGAAPPVPATAGALGRNGDHAIEERAAEQADQPLDVHTPEPLDAKATGGSGGDTERADIDLVDHRAGDDVDDAGLEPFDAEEEQSAIEREASRTVELRPSTLRRAGIAAPTMPRSPTELSAGWSRPGLASQPASDQEEPPDRPSDADEP